MKSGEPESIDDLKIVLSTKENSPTSTLEVVTEATRWLKAALKGAGVTYSYASCEEQDHYGFAAFTIIRGYRGELVCLDLRVAEVADRPYAYAEVRSLGKTAGKLFPFFGMIETEEQREPLLHYIADFLLSTEA
jgi:hypothetical protein